MDSWKLLRIVFTWLTIASAIFLVFAFANWDMNPGKWDSLSRGMCGFFMAILSTLLTVSFTDDSN